MIDVYEADRRLEVLGPWEFVREFAEYWSRPLVDGDGYSDSELDAAEERLGFALPVAFRRAYQLFGRRDDLTSNHDRLRPPGELEVDERGEALVFRDENQGAATWGVLLEDLAAEDPPVYMKPDLAMREQERWEGWQGRFSQVCVEIVLAESVHDMKLADERDQVEEDAAILERDFSRMPLQGEARWFAGPDVILRDDGLDWLSVRARTEEALERVRHRMPGDWING
ncbi:hypothetical protein GCM10010191_23640 [Actinomadura vinacea]|uniref:SMI1/KNR4 family protein n=1 Tax=Actinomadura vinacea TaxID=115336 RepID=A0ABN3IV67_9ACTN